MENTNSIQFPNDQPEWFIAVGDQFKGPFKASEVYQKLQAEEVSWVDFCYREKEGKWIRLVDQSVFSALQPEAPKAKPVITPPPAPPKKVEEEINWFLFQNEAQTGPYPTGELVRLARAGQIAANAFVWQENFTDWKPFQEVSEFKVSTPPPFSKSAAPVSAAPIPAAKSEKRAAPRKPLVAQIYIANHAELVVGMCRDISIGGMQVLTEHVPGGVGTAIRMNVTPPQDSGIHPFVAQGVVVRVLEDQRGFSFRFIEISDDAKKAIESYIA